MTRTIPNSDTVFLAAHIDACALWRMFMPHLSLDGSGFFCFAQNPDFSRLARYDIAVVQRCCTPEQLRFIGIAADLGMRVVYDLDDDVWDIPRENPAYGPLMQYKEGFGHCIRHVDVVSVSTVALRSAVRRNVRHMVNARTGREIPVIVAENRLDSRLFAEPVRSNRLTVGWAGSSSHIGDIRLIEEAVTACAKEFPGVVFQFRGCAIPEDSPLRVPRFEHRLWTPVTEYGGRMPLWGWSIALAPVTSHPFNDSKSPIKMVEAAYCGIPCLASLAQPYWDFVQHDPELEWLICASPAKFTAKLRELLHDEGRRAYLGKRAHQVAMRYYTFDYPHDGWQRVLEAARAY